MKTLIINLILILLLTTVSFSQGTTQYVYDDNGRLQAVISSGGETAVYHYDEAGNLILISRQDHPVVSLNSFSPDSGTAGTEITVLGTGFKNILTENSVTINGTTAQVTSVSLGSLTFVIPSNAVTGKITISNANGNFTSKANLIIGENVEITSFSPSVASIGSSVTISGIGFDGLFPQNNHVSFNAQNASATSSSTASLNVEVTPNATSGKVSLVNQYGNSTSSQDIFIPPSPYIATDVQVADRLVANTTKNVSLSGVNNIALLLIDANVGQNLTFQFRNLTTASNVILRSPTGNVIFQRNINLPTVIDSDPVSANGTYTLSVNLPVGGSLTVKADVNLLNSITPNGLPVSLSFPDVGTVQRLVFDANAGQVMSISVNNSNANGVIEVISETTGNVLETNMFGANSTNTPSIMLPNAGRYSLRVYPQFLTVQPGVASFALVFETFETISISPNSAAQTLSINTPGKNFNAVFNANQGKNLSILLNSSTLQNVKVSLFSPENVLITEKFSFINNKMYFDSRLSTETGTYRLEVNPIGNITGNLDLAVYEFDDLVYNLPTDGTQINVSTTYPGQNATINFAGVAGDNTGLTLSSITNTFTKVSILAPNGTTVYAPAFVNGTQQFIPLNNLPLTGNYKVVFDPQEETISSAAVKLGQPAEITGQISINGNPLAVSLLAGQNARITFNGNAGQRVFIKLNNSSINSAGITLKKPDGTILYSNYFYSDGKGIDILNLPTTGNYEVFIQPNSSGSGSFEISASTSATIAANSYGITELFLTPNQTASTTFAGETGNIFNLIANSDPNQTFEATVKIYTPDGNLWLTVPLNQGIFYENLPQTGNYRIDITPSGGLTGQIELFLPANGGSKPVTKKKIK
jgi:YD repeat-containing protein